MRIVFQSGLLTDSIRDSIFLEPDMQSCIGTAITAIVFALEEGFDVNIGKLFDWPT